MTFSEFLVRAALALLVTICLSGCLPSAQSRLDEEKEPHFLAGKTRLNAMDYQGAFESFEKALEVNPSSASAHFELGCLCDQKESDPAAAIYHYDRYLRLRPQAENAEIVRTRILGCKQELARTVSLGPVNQSLQNELERLRDENQRLREQLEQCRTSTARLQTAAGAEPVAARPAAMRPQPPPAGLLANAAAGSASRNSISSSARTHTIKQGETLTAIARRHGLKVAALIAANPHLEERRLRIGQTIALPLS
jgi:tetratricopeptide (TPR) repeat protein